MSLVTTHRSYLSRRAWHRARVRAVLPEPTGPPMPTRRGWPFMGESFVFLGCVRGSGGAQTTPLGRQGRVVEQAFELGGCGPVRVGEVEGAGFGHAAVRAYQFVAGG